MKITLDIPDNYEELATFSEKDHTELQKKVISKDDFRIMMQFADVAITTEMGVIPSREVGFMRLTFFYNPLSDLDSEKDV